MIKSSNLHNTIPTKLMIFNCDIAWYDDKGRRHTTTIESDRTERDFIRQLVEARYPAKKVAINKVVQKP